VAANEWYLRLLVSCADAGGTVKSLQADISKDDDVKRMVRFVEDEFGHLDYAFNNAGE
jgi:NAD(P)-dependent dehydrogenase (short-subunit alcohol dehydrogenase family)